MPEPSVTDSRSDLLTIAAIAIVIYAAASQIHEGIGHGGACLIVGCKPQMITTMQFIGDESTLSRAGVRVVSAGGTVANLVAAVVAALFFKRARGNPGGAWFFLWLFVTINLLQATGYLLYSGALNIGDWSVVVGDLRPPWLWRGALIAVGAFTYWLTVKWAMATLGRRLRASADARVAEANRYSLTAYAAGGLMSIVAGLLDPGEASVGLKLVLISAVAASIGGASGLAWGPQMLRDTAFGAERLPALAVTRSWEWIAAGIVVAAVFIFIIGRGVRL